MHSRHGVSVLRALFEPALLELQRGPIELVDQLGVPLPQPRFWAKSSVVKRWNLAMIRLSSVFMPQPHCCHPAPPRRWFIRCVLLRSTHPTPPLEAEYATLSPSAACAIAPP